MRVAIKNKYSARVGEGWVEINPTSLSGTGTTGVGDSLTSNKYNR